MNKFFPLALVCMACLSTWLETLSALAQNPEKTSVANETLTVLHPEHYRSVPDADVWIYFPIDLSDEDQRQCFRREDAARMELTKQRGTQYRSDEMGQVHFTAESERIWTLVEHGEYSGFDDYNTNNGAPFDVKLHPASRFKVTLRTADGQLAPNTAFCLTYRDKSQFHRYFGDRLFVDQQATLQVENLGIHRPGNYRGNDVGLVPCIPLADDDAVQFASMPLDPSCFANGDLTLFLPKTGSIRVNLLHQDGSKVEGKGSLLILPVKPLGKERARTPLVKVELKDSSFYLPYVGLDGFYQARLSLWGTSGNYSTDTRIAGPMKVGDEIEVTVRVPNASSQPTVADRHEQPIDSSNQNIESKPTLLSGKIADPNGRPIHDADITLWSGPWDQAVIANGKKRIVGRKSNADGSFLIPGPTHLPGPYFVEIIAGGYEPFQTEVNIGQTDLQFQLDSLGKLIGSVHLPSDIELDEIDILFLSSPLKRPYSLRPTPTPGLYGIEVSGISEMEFSLAVRTSFNEYVFKQGGLRFQPNTVQHPAELQPLDLRDKLHKLVLAVRSPNGELIPSRMTFSDEQREFTRFAKAKPQQIVYTKPYRLIQVRAAGFNGYNLRNATGAHDMTLTPSDRVEVRIPKKIVGLANVTTTLYADYHDILKSVTAGAFDANGVADLYIPERGDYKVGLRTTWKRGSQVATRTWPTELLSNLRGGKIVTLDVPTSLIQAWAKEVNQDFQRN